MVLTLRCNRYIRMRQTVSLWVIILEDERPHAILRLWWVGDQYRSESMNPSLIFYPKPTTKFSHLRNSLLKPSQINYHDFEDTSYDAPFVSCSSGR